MGNNDEITLEDVEDYDTEHASAIRLVAHVQKRALGLLRVGHGGGFWYNVAKGWSIVILRVFIGLMALTGILEIAAMALSIARPIEFCDPSKKCMKLWSFIDVVPYSSSNVTQVEHTPVVPGGVGKLALFHMLITITAGFITIIKTFFLYLHVVDEVKVTPFLISVVKCIQISFMGMGMILAYTVHARNAYDGSTTPKENEIWLDNYWTWNSPNGTDWYMVWFWLVCGGVGVHYFMQLFSFEYSLLFDHSRKLRLPESPTQQAASGKSGVAKRK